MTSSELLDQARKLLGIKLESATVTDSVPVMPVIKKALLQVAKLEDGSTIGTESDKPFEIGDNILIADSDGNTSCPSDGDYITTDGLTITVQSCTISNLTPKSDAGTEDAPSTDEAAQSINQLKELNDEVEFLKQENKKLKIELETAKQDKIQLTSVVELLKSEPAAEPTVRTASASSDNTIKHNKALHTKSDYLIGIGKILNSK